MLELMQFTTCIHSHPCIFLHANTSVRAHLAIVKMIIQCDHIVLSAIIIKKEKKDNNKFKVEVSIAVR